MDLYNASFGEEDEPEMAMTTEEFDAAKAELEETINRGEAAIRLSQNPDFKMLMLDGYFKAETERLVDLLTCGKISRNVREGCAEDLDAIGKAKSYFSTAVQASNSAREELKELEAARDEALEAAAEGETLGE